MSADDDRWVAMIRRHEVEKADLELKQAEGMAVLAAELGFEGQADGWRRRAAALQTDPVRAAILHATAATLRTVAEWDAQVGDLYQVADQVEALLEPADETDSLRDACCPVCEEVDCDDSCPLAPVRQDQIERT